MAIREIKPVSPLENLFEPETHNRNIRETSPAEPLAGKWSLSAPWRPSLSLLSVQFPKLNHNPPVYVLVGLATAALAILFGAATSGTFYGPASGRFTGLFATVFYQYQLGTMVEFVGILILWESVKGLFHKR